MDHDASLWTRRDVLKVAGAASAGLCVGPLVAAGGPKVGLVVNPDDAAVTSAPAQWAVGRLRDALTARGVAVRTYRRATDVADDEVLAEIQSRPTRPKTLGTIT